MTRAMHPGPCGLTLHAGFLVALAFAMAMPLGAMAQDAADELEQVKAERQRLEAQFDEQNRQCYQKLSVNDCKREVQLRRSDALRPVIVRQRELEAASRKQRADEQRKKIQERREAHDKRMQERGGEPVTLPPEAPVSPKPN